MKRKINIDNNFITAPHTICQLSDNNVKVINEYQQEKYEIIDKRDSIKLFGQYAGLLKEIRNRDTVKILDIGGGSGYFALKLYEYFSDKHCEVFVLDTTKYDTWDKNTDKITFIKGSANNLNTLFAEKSFDLIFTNRVFHHFVRGSWKQTMDGILDIMKQIAYVLNQDGFFCITDYFYNGFLYDKAPSKLIYSLTSCKIKPLIAIFSKFGSMSAGIGVCFLSKKMWFNLFSQVGFVIETLYEGENYKVRWYKKLFLLIKNCKAGNILILKKSD
jgi:ubiquinone/menaquinone biosynthesis C-methylase UbiE